MIIENLPVDKVKEIFPNCNFLWEKPLYKILNLLPDWKFVGGCVRDSLLGIQTFDIDVTTTVSPEDVIKTFQGKYTLYTIGKEFGTVTLVLDAKKLYKNPDLEDNLKIEITTTRHDTETDGRHAKVTFCKSYFEDSKRRDFTINALMKHGDEITDFHGGLSDLKNKQITFIGNANHRIQEDYLRIMRYFRFSLRFGETTDRYYELFKRNLEGLGRLSMERIISEISLMCKYEKAYETFQILNQLGISKKLFDCELVIDNKLCNLPLDIQLVKIFANCQKDLPVSREIRRLRSAKNLPDKYLSAAYLWKKYQDRTLVEKFLQINNLAIPSNWTIPHYDFNNIEQSQRSKIEVLLRYCVLKEIEITELMK